MSTESTTTPETAPPPAPPQLGYFKKIFVNQPFFVERERVEFEVLGGELGVIATPKGSLLDQALTEAARVKRGGIVVIDAPTYDDLKKKRPFAPSAKKSKPTLQIFRPRSLGKPSSNPGAPAAVDKVSGSAPVEPVGGGGPGEAGKPSPAPASATPFQPATAKKQFKMPVNKTTDSRSLSGGTPITDEAD